MSPTRRVAAQKTDAVRSTKARRMMQAVAAWAEAQYNAWTSRRADELHRDLGYVPANELAWEKFWAHIGIKGPSGSHYRQMQRLPSLEAALKMAALDRKILDILEISEEDLDLQKVIERWGKLAPEARQRILGIAREPTPGGADAGRGESQKGGESENDQASTRRGRTGRSDRPVADTDTGPAPAGARRRHV